MRPLKNFLKVLLILIPLFGMAQVKISKNKQTLATSIEKHEAELIELSDKIWSYAETALTESQSSKVLSDYAEEQGFRVTRGVAEMPTAFIAEYGSGKPIIGILGEFDALPGLSQKAQTGKDPVTAGNPGHGCGHNLFGVASLGAALAVKELIDQGKIKGTIRFYGTPAEETIGGKIYMARAGLFDDLDASIDWHPGDKIEAAVQSSQALIDFKVSFTGKTSHAAADPWNGISAVDAMELYTTGINYLREHVKPSVRIHYLIEDAGDVVNVVPEHARIWTRVRDSKREGMYEVYQKVLKIAEGAATMTGATYEIKLVSGMHEILINRTGAEALQKNLELLGNITYTEQETAFAKAIQEATNKPQVGIDGTVKPLRVTEKDPPGGSTDVGDVSWISPHITMSVTTAAKGTPWHSWAVVACGGMSIGHKSIPYAAKAMSFTMIDMFENQNLIDAMKKEFKERKGDYIYQAILPEGPPPVPVVAGGE